jgi:hypothetical protein
MTAPRIIFPASLVLGRPRWRSYYRSCRTMHGLALQRRGPGQRLVVQGFFDWGFVLVVVTACFAILPAIIEGAAADGQPSEQGLLAGTRAARSDDGVSARRDAVPAAQVRFPSSGHWLVIRVNLGLEPALPSPLMWTLLAGFGLCVGPAAALSLSGAASAR